MPKFLALRSKLFDFRLLPSPKTSFSLPNDKTNWPWPSVTRTGPLKRQVFFHICFLVSAISWKVESCMYHRFEKASLNVVLGKINSKTSHSQSKKLCSFLIWKILTYKYTFEAERLGYANI